MHVTAIQQLRRSDGMTLVELLVATAMTLVIIFGASAIILSALNVNQQIGARVGAVQEGRTGLETLLQQLNSGCLASDISPVMATTSSGISPVVSSDASDLVFVSGVGDSVNGAPTEHVVTVRSSGQLIDSSYANTGGAPPALGTPSTWTFATKASSIQVLMEHVVTGSAPMFQYYSYSNSANPNSNSLLNAVALTPPLSASTAPTIAAVDIDLRVEPPGSNFNSTETSELTDSATFRQTAANPNATNFPCD